MLSNNSIFECHLNYYSIEHVQNVIGFYSTNKQKEKKNKVLTMKKDMILIDFFFSECAGFPAMVIR